MSRVPLSRGGPGLVVVDEVIPHARHSAVPHPGILRLASEAGWNLARMVEVQRQQVVLLGGLLVVVGHLEDHLHVV